MDKNRNYACLAALGLTIALGLAGCKSNTPQQSTAESTPPDNGQSTAQNPQNQDPADVNQAPAAAAAPAESQPAAPVQSQPAAQPESQPAAQPEPQPAAPAESQAESSNPPSDNYYPGYAETEAPEQAPQPPPPLPEYEQPECPAPNYIWTPGHWGWGPGGYYWVPGVWVQAPYEGALWTPGYWGFLGTHYIWHRGYWGPHIGFYGGINYGFGYTGVGYYGGFWSNRGFQYNRAVTRVNTTVITNVYNRRVINNVTITNTRVSYNGGSGGVRYEPSRAELAASRERHVARLPAQVEVARAAAANRAQFASFNHGRPQVVAMTKPVAVKRIAPPAAAVNPGVRREARIPPAGAAPMESRPATPAYRPATPGYRPATPAPRSATPARPQTEGPPRPAYRAEPRREAPAVRPAQPPPARPAMRAPTRPVPHETQTRKAPPHQPSRTEKQPERRPNEHNPR